MFALFRGPGYFFDGLQMLLRPGLRSFVIVPLLINVVLFTLLAIWLTGEFGTLVDRYTPQLPDWLSWLSSVIWVLFALFIAVTIFFTFTLVANLIGAPFYSLLAEAAEMQMTGELVSESGWSQVVREAPGAIMDELRKLKYFLLIAIPLLLLFFFPGFNLIAPFLWGIFSAWMLALEYLDYPLGNHNMRLAQQRKLIANHRPVAFGFGAMVLLATLIPILNLLAMPAATLGATKLWVKEIKPKQQKAINQQ